MQSACFAVLVTFSSLSLLLLLHCAYIIVLLFSAADYNLLMFLTSVALLHCDAMHRHVANIIVCILCSCCQMIYYCCPCFYFAKSNCLSSFFVKELPVECYCATQIILDGHEFDRKFHSEDLNEVVVQILVSSWIVPPISTELVNCSSWLFLRVDFEEFAPTQCAAGRSGAKVTRKRWESCQFRSCRLLVAICENLEFPWPEFATLFYFRPCKQNVRFGVEQT